MPKYFHCLPLKIDIITSFVEETDWVPDLPAISQLLFRSLNLDFHIFSFQFQVLFCLCCVRLYLNIINLNNTYKTCKINK
jgi:hypothetical protein